MTTNWALPTQVEQYAESGAETAHVAWLEIDNFSSLKNRDGKHTKTVRELLHIARDPRHDIQEKTYFLRVTGFQFQNIPAVILGIELRLTMNRFGRVTDDVVQLCVNGETIGENQADLMLDPIKTYGSTTDLWKTSITPAVIQNSSFGVVFRFQSHPRWPHKSSALIDSIELRIH